MLEGNNGSAGAPDGKTWFFLRFPHQQNKVQSSRCSGEKEINVEQVLDVLKVMVLSRVSSIANGLKIVALSHQFTT